MMEGGRGVVTLRSERYDLSFLVAGYKDMSDRLTRANNLTWF